jgi:hypothetical protein
LTGSSSSWKGGVLIEGRSFQERKQSFGPVNIVSEQQRSRKTSEGITGEEECCFGYTA